MNRVGIFITGTTRGLGEKLYLLFNSSDCIGINRKKIMPSDIVLDLADKTLDLRVLKTKMDAYDIIVFINNAATIEPVKELERVTVEEVRYINNLNFISPVSIISEIIKSHKKYIIINITSGAAFTTNEKLGMYSATKASMHRYIEILKKEKKENTQALRIANFDPGRMQTEMQKLLIEKKGLEAIYESLQTSNDVAEKLYAQIKKDIT